MGYYTSYSMAVKHVNSAEEFAKLQEELKKRGIINYALDDGYYDASNHEAEFYCYDVVKWYDYRDDMRGIGAEGNKPAVPGISEIFHDMVFCVHGEGENNEDLWDCYFHNGDCEECCAEVVYPKPQRIKWEDD